MDTFFDKAKKLSHKQSKELAALCGGAAILLLVAGFISGGGTAAIGKSIALNSVSPSSQTASIFPCGWFGDCATPIIITDTLTANTYTSTPGAPVTLSWALFSTYTGVLFNPTCITNSNAAMGYNTRNYCAISGVGQVGAYYQWTPNGCYTYNNFDGSVTYYDCYTLAGGSGYTGSVVVHPAVTTTYTLSTDSLGWSSVAYPPNSVTITIPAPPPPPPPPPPAAISAGATVTSPVNVGQSATIYFHADSSDPPTQCQINNYNDTAALKYVAGCPSSANQSYTTPVYTVPGTYAYKFYYARPSWTLAQTVNVVVNNIAPLGSCTDIPLQTTVPNGCVTPSPAPGICTPSGGSYSGDTNTCSCPSGMELSGSACIKIPLCNNGLADSYAPSCTCPSGQYQPLASNSCVPLPICTNGLNISYSPSCTCPGGQIQSGAACVLQGVIQSFTANPSRVLKGNTATISWSTSNMTSCSLSSLVNTGTSALSSALSSSVSPVINSKTIFTLSCSDASGASYSASATVNLIPQTTEQ